MLSAPHSGEFAEQLLKHVRDTTATPPDWNSHVLVSGADTKSSSGCCRTSAKSNAASRVGCCEFDEILVLLLTTLRGLSHFLVECTGSIKESLNFGLEVGDALLNILNGCLEI